MIEAFVEYLKAKSAPASSLELAQRVLKMTIQDEHIADKIIRPLLQNTAQIELDNDHLWHVVHTTPAPVERIEMILCKFLPEKSRSIFHWLEAGCVAVCNGRIVDEKIFPLRGDEIEKEFHDLLQTIGGRPMVFDGFGNQISLFHRAAYLFNGMEIEQPLYSLKRLLKLTYPQKIIHEPAQAADALGLAFYESDELHAQLRYFAEEFLTLMQTLHSRGINTRDDFIYFYEGSRQDVDYSSYAFDRSFIDALPITPGVYVMRDRDDRVIYVGKAKNLAARVRSYFKNSGDVEDKVKLIRDRLYHIDIDHTGSELEALLLEQKYIQQFHPPINRQLKIRGRVRKQKSRYQRIVLLPAEKADLIRVYLLSSEWGVQSMEVAKDLSNFSELKTLVGKFFFSKDKPDSETADENLEIVTSWLSLHEDDIHGIDMRKIACPMEAERILKDHISSFFKHDEKVIHY